ncbi:hypothetical protein FJTKL_00776 [Diaporthe vaccinii]|uniref:Uncharacterized protein n=1 Tax=Diaporthe vaccinii TaxID=105482 RepID=A0ABR4E2E9_9PEZI
MVAAILKQLVLKVSRREHWTSTQIFQPLTDVDEDHHKGYFSDPYHVPYANETRVYISGTTHKYLECDGELTPKCATPSNIAWDYTTALNHTMTKAKVQVCGVAGIHPFQTVSNDKKSWDAAVTLHVLEESKKCNGTSGWSVIVHASPVGPTTETPPDSWEGDQVLVGNFKDNVDANYDGKYFRTPEGKLYLVYQKQISKPPKRDGVYAWPMKDPLTLATDNATLLLGPDEGLNSENYHNHSDNAFKLIETGNIRAINGKFLMAYSVGAYNRPTYKLAVAYSDTFLPENGQQYRKVMKENPEGLWGSPKTQKEVYYLLQADQKHLGWHYIRDQVLAPGVPTVAKIGAGNTWVLTFAGYDPNDAGANDTDPDLYEASRRRPFFIDLDVNIPPNTSVKQASDQELQGWITPSHG